jgi:hypothetical protein
LLGIDIYVAWGWVARLLSGYRTLRGWKERLGIVHPYKGDLKLDGEISHLLKLDIYQGPERAPPNDRSSDAAGRIFAVLPTGEYAIWVSRTAADPKFDALGAASFLLRFDHLDHGNCAPILKRQPSIAFAR